MLNHPYTCFPLNILNRGNFVLFRYKGCFLIFLESHTFTVKAPILQTFEHMLNFT